MRRPRIGVKRRDLLRLRGRHAAGLETAAVLEAEPRGIGLIRAHRPAMGSYFEIRLPATTPGGVELAYCALDLVDALEAQLTVYRDDSELSRLNNTAHFGPIEVEPCLYELLQVATALSHETAGAYDVASGALSEAWGFVKGPKRVPDPAVLTDARARTGSHHLRLDPERRTVAFDRAGVRINLGSIGKGYAIDRAVEILAAHWWPTSCWCTAGVPASMRWARHREILAAGGRSHFRIRS